MSGRGVTVVFTHGAWADGSSWSKVIGLFAARGIKSVGRSLIITPWLGFALVCCALFSYLAPELRVFHFANKPES